MGKDKKRSSFSGQLGFIMAAAGSAVGLGNIWRFPYLAAKDGGGLFILCYLILALTFGFALLTTEIAIGRKTRQSPLTAYARIHPKWGGIGVLACLVPTIILPYYCSIGGWVFKYLSVYVTGQGVAAAEDGYFTSFITAPTEPMVWMLIYFAITSFIIICGVEKGIEKYSKILMPILVVMVIGISLFSLTLSHTDAQGVTRTGLQGLKVYLIPDFTGLTLKQLMIVIMDAMGQLFFSISVAMGIMVAYGSYARKDTNLMTSINQIEIFDTSIALLAGLMIIPAVFCFMGIDGMSAGPGLIFVSLPKVFLAMGGIGRIIGLVFFLIVSFAAVTSSVSVMEAIVSSLMDAFGLSRKKASVLVAIYTLIMGIIVCLGYNKLYFEITLPNGTVAQILDIMDYISNNVLMPLVAFLTCILIGWVVKPKVIIDEVTQGKFKFQRKTLYIIMIKFVAPILLLVLLLQSVGLI
ncbi:MAG: sodium-dependent transporter [Eubacteriales bacterium]|nr:sodium-dependent transporter [Eubacteriales bacterium]